ncbi:MAG: (deoxy)nucleoside triphosphate pyrophosphohydrolase [Proteobacteria bacterium]|nr:MAG: (deoxy)nucleoside triphosphate pyrophosphohydrolase [Pseudomonadota bacterium]
MISAAVGILADASGRVLVAKRPPGKVCSGKWEFPGGKIEDGETSLTALTREMKEELDVEIAGARYLVEHVNDFPDRRVRLDVWLVREWRGFARGVENQAIRWLEPERIRELDFLPGIEAILPLLVEALVDDDAKRRS